MRKCGWGSWLRRFSGRENWGSFEIKMRKKLTPMEKFELWKYCVGSVNMSIKDIILFLTIGLLISVSSNSPYNLFVFNLALWLFFILYILVIFRLVLTGEEEEEKRYYKIIERIEK